MDPDSRYDLNFAEGPGGEHTTTLAGEGRAVTRKHILDLAEGAGVPTATALATIEEVAAAVATWPAVARELEVATSRRQAIGARLDFCRDALR